MSGMRLFVVGMVLFSACVDPCRRLGEGSRTAGLALTPSTRGLDLTGVRSSFSYGEAEDTVLAVWGSYE